MIHLSIIVAVLNSPEVVRRHVLHFQQMPFPEDVEWILVDDKSDPPLRREDYDLPRFRIIRHLRPGVWTQPLARNLGAKYAVGEKLLCTDIDHIITKPLLDYCRATPLDYVKFNREVATLDEQGRVVQTKDAVFAYGFQQAMFDANGFVIGPHTNSFLVKKSVFLSLGGMPHNRTRIGRHPNREEIPLRHHIHDLEKAGKIQILDYTSPNFDQAPTIYMIPNGQICGDRNHNPFGLFHQLPRMTRRMPRVSAEVQ